MNIVYRAATLLLVSSVLIPRFSDAAAVPERKETVGVALIGAGSEDLSHQLSMRAGEIGIDVLSSAARPFSAVREDSALLADIRAASWDTIVLTGHPAFDKALVIDGTFRVGDQSQLLHHGRLLIDEIRRAGAQAVLLVPPLGPGAPTVDRQAVAWAYTRLGREGGAKLAPVSDAFARVRRRHPDLALYDPFGEEWSAAGAYLAASVVEATVTGHFPGAPTGPQPAEPEEGREGRVPAADGLSAEARLLLNREAWAAVRDLAAVGGYRDIPPPPFPAVPTLSRGTEVPVERLGGTWKGPLRLYPWPATLELQVATEGGSPRVSGRVRFDDGREDVTFDASEPSYQNGILSFRNPADLANGKTLYQLVFRQPRLTGVAELVTEDGGAYAIGGCELTRAQQ